MVFLNDTLRKRGKIVDRDIYLPFTYGENKYLPLVEKNTGGNPSPPKNIPFLPHKYLSVLVVLTPPSPRLVFYSPYKLNTNARSKA